MFLKNLMACFNPLESRPASISAPAPAPAQGTTGLAAILEQTDLMCLLSARDLLALCAVNKAIRGTVLNSPEKLAAAVRRPTPTVPPRILDRCAWLETLTLTKGTIRMHNIVESKHLFYCASWAPDGSKFTHRGGPSGTLKIADSKTGNTLCKEIIQGGRLQPQYWFSDNQRFAGIKGGEDGWFALVYKVGQTISPLWRIKLPGNVWSITGPPDGSFLAAFNRRGTVLFIKPETGEIFIRGNIDCPSLRFGDDLEIERLQIHSNRGRITVYHGSIQRDEPDFITVLDLAQYGELDSYGNSSLFSIREVFDRRYIKDVDISPDGETLGYVTQAGRFLMRQIPETVEFDSELEEDFEYGVLGLKFLPDGRHIALQMPTRNVGERLVKVFDYESNQLGDFVCNLVTNCDLKDLHFSNDCRKFSGVYESNNRGAKSGFIASLNLPSKG